MHTRVVLNLGGIIKKRRTKQLDKEIPLIKTNFDRDFLHSKTKSIRTSLRKQHIQQQPPSLLSPSQFSPRKASARWGQEVGEAQFS